MAGKAKDKTKITIPYVRPTLFKAIMAPFVKEGKFGTFFARHFKDNWVTFYEARNGIYHILIYLRDNFGPGRIYLPSDICEVVRMSARLAHYKIIYYKGGPIGIRKKDVLLVTDSTIVPPEGIYSIEDNARHPYYPDARFDFTLYSFGASKPLSGFGGGLVIVNNRKFRSFLKIKRLLKAPDKSLEGKAWINYIRWRVIEYEPLHRNQKVIGTFRRARRLVKGNYMRTYQISNLPFKMMEISQRIVGDGLK